MVPATRAGYRVALSGEEGSLLELISDVLLDAGHTVSAREAPDVVVAILGRAETVLGRLLLARQRTYPVPVVVVIPYDDRRLAQQAMRLGAFATYASGMPLAALVEAVELAGRHRGSVRPATAR